MKNRNKIIYLIATGLLTIHMVLSVGVYFFHHTMVSEMFASLGFPVYIIYPLGVLKLLGLIAIWTNKSKMLKEWAYAGFVFVFLLAASAHLNVQDGHFIAPLVALLIVSVSYAFYKLP